MVGYCGDNGGEEAHDVASIRVVIALFPKVFWTHFGNEFTVAQGLCRWV